MTRENNSKKINEIYQKLDFFVGQTSKGTNEYLAAAALLNDYRVEISSVNDYTAMSSRRINEISKSIDSVFANLHISYPNPKGSS